MLTFGTKFLFKQIHEKQNNRKILITVVHNMKVMIVIASLDLILECFVLKVAFFFHFRIMITFLTDYNYNVWSFVLYISRRKLWLKTYFNKVSLFEWEVFFTFFYLFLPFFSFVYYNERKNLIIMVSARENKNKLKFYGDDS